jgi:hypothetical protein
MNLTDVSDLDVPARAPARNSLHVRFTIAAAGRTGSL